MHVVPYFVTVWTKSPWGHYGRCFRWSLSIILHDYRLSASNFVSGPSSVQPTIPVESLVSGNELGVPLDLWVNKPRSWIMPENISIVESLPPQYHKGSSNSEDNIGNCNDTNSTLQQPPNIPQRNSSPPDVPTHIASQNHLLLYRSLITNPSISTLRSSTIQDYELTAIASESLKIYGARNYPCEWRGPGWIFFGKRFGRPTYLHQ